MASMNPVTSLHIGDLWHGDNRNTRGRTIQIVQIWGSIEGRFDPYLSVKVLSDSRRPGDTGWSFYSRVSWLQTAYRPGPPA